MDKTVKIVKQYDVAVIGGGVAGMSAAIAAARHGAKTVLIQNRPVLGGNASSEIRMHICGADKHCKRQNARETGIIEEIQLKNKSRNPEYSYPIFDNVLWECANFEDGLDLFLNLHIDNVQTENNNIISVSGTQQTTEKHFTFFASLFIDATGDASIGAKAGAEYMYGREDKTTFNEPDGLDKADHCTMGNSIMFQAKDVGHPVKYTKPDWAYSYTEEDLKCRTHDDIHSGYWWVELGGNDLNTIGDAETIRDELYKTVYGLWDHIKNGGDHGADNFELEWVCQLPGKRESRRLLGDYVLCENDLLNTVHFDDAIAYGGWDMDCHVIDGFRNGNNEPTKYIGFPDLYEIPYRCVVSKNIDNLFLSGRAFSCSHLAFASTRVMATCAVVAQAAGTAAALAIKYDTTPRGIYEHIDELQQTLLADDCYIPNVKNHDENDLALSSTVSASSTKEGFDSKNIINGVARQVHDNVNCWCSNGIDENGETVELKLKKCSKIHEVDVAFDSNLSKQLTITVNEYVKTCEQPTLPDELVKDYEIILQKDGKTVAKKEVKNNVLRRNKIKFDETECDTVLVRAFATYGARDIKIYEIRAY